MLLFVPDRLRLQEVLPQEGNVITLRIVRELREALSFTEEEIKRLDLREQDVNGVAALTWTQEADLGKEVAIGEVAHDIIVKSLRKLDQQQRLKDCHLPLWERFVEPAAAVREAEEIARGG